MEKQPEKENAENKAIGKIKKAIESAEDLSFGHIFELKEISKPNKCAAVIRATVTVTAKIDL